MNRLLIGTAVLAISASASAPFSNAQAQTSADTTVDEIIVTARKRAESLQDVPLAVSVTTQEQLERDQIFNLNDLARTTPALEVVQTFGGESNGGGRIRGIGTNVFDPSFSPSVAYVVDQVPVGNTSFPSLFDLAQVETLRGPQGTLFGQGASAGVINITTIQPEIGSGFFGKAGVDYSPDDSLGSESSVLTFNAGVNIPLGDRAAARIAGQYRQDEGVQTNVTTGNDTRDRFLNLRGQLKLDVSESFTNNIKVEYGKLDTRNRNFFAFSDDLVGDEPRPGPPGTTARTIQLACGNTLSGGYPDEYCSSFDDDIDFESFAVSNVAEFEISENLSLTSVSSYRTLDENIVQVNFSRQADPGVRAGDFNLADSRKQLSQELRFNYVGTGYDVVFGGFYQSFDFKRRPIDSSIPLGGNPVTGPTGFCVGSTSFFPAGGIPLCFGPDNGSTFIQTDIENSTLAAFADATVEMSDTFDIFGGVRFTTFENETVLGVRNTVNTPNTALGDLEIDEDNLSGRLGFRYRPSAVQTYYGSISLGYKPGGITPNDLFDDPATPEREDISFLDAEDSLALELGGKFALDSGVNIDANLFFTENDGYHIQRALPTTEGELVSIPINSEAESFGFEISAYGDVTENLSYNVGYLFNDATFTEDGFLGDDGTPLTGEQLNLAPKHKITLSGQYTRPMTDSFEGFLNSNIVYKSKILGALANPDFFTQDSGINIGGAVGIQDPEGAWRASIYVRNLTKNRELTSLFQDPGDPTSRRGWPGAGLTTRLVGATLDVNF